MHAPSGVRVSGEARLQRPCGRVEHRELKQVEQALPPRGACRRPLAVVASCHGDPVQRWAVVRGGEEQKVDGLEDRQAEDKEDDRDA